MVVPFTAGAEAGIDQALDLAGLCHKMEELAGPAAPCIASSDLHLELPPGVELTSDMSAGTRELLERLEGATGR